MATRNGTIRSTIKGLHLVSGLCDGVLTGAEASAGFPSLPCAKENEALPLVWATTNGTGGKWRKKKRNDFGRRVRRAGVFVAAIDAVLHVRPRERLVLRRHRRRGRRLCAG